MQISLSQKETAQRLSLWLLQWRPYSEVYFCFSVSKYQIDKKSGDQSQTCCVTWGLLHPSLSLQKNEPGLRTCPDPCFSSVYQKNRPIQWNVPSHDFRDTHTWCSGSAFHKHGGNAGFGGSGWGLANDSTERWVSVNPRAALPGFQFPLHPSVV